MNTTQIFMSCSLETNMSSAYIFWKEEIWLPPNSTWSDIEHEDKAQFGHLAFPLPLAFLMMVARFFLDKFFYRFVRKENSFFLSIPKRCFVNCECNNFQEAFNLY